MKLNLKGIVKSVIAGCTIVGGAILGNEARKCFTKPVADDYDEYDDDVFEDATEATEPAEEADDEPDEVPED